VISRSARLVCGAKLRSSLHIFYFYIQPSRILDLLKPRKGWAPSLLQASSLLKMWISGLIRFMILVWFVLWVLILNLIFDLVYLCVLILISDSDFGLWVYRSHSSFSTRIISFGPFSSAWVFCRTQFSSLVLLLLFWCARLVLLILFWCGLYLICWLACFILVSGFWVCEILQFLLLVTFGLCVYEICSVLFASFVFGRLGFVK
jgi:hypothetical protein